MWPQPVGFGPGLAQEVPARALLTALAEELPMRALALTLCLVLTPALPAVATVTFTVGPGTDCEFPDLRTAVDAAEGHPDPDRILRVTAGVYPDTNLVLQESMQIVGGFASCAPDSPPSSLRSILRAPANRAVVVVRGANAGLPKLTIQLAHLSLEGGNHSAGGGLAIALGADVELDDVLVLANRAEENGGGIFLDGTAGATLTLRRTGINGNQAVRGGGLFCRDGGRINAGEGTGWFGNQATLGGGLFAETGCELELAGPLRIVNNRASHGGGLYLQSGARTALRGGPDAVLEVVGNRVTAGGAEGGTGGGALVSGATSRLEAANVTFARNRALHSDGFGGLGGALMVTSRATARLTGGGGVGCTEPGCSLLESNEAVTGAAVAVQHGATAEILGTTIVDHHPAEAVVVAAGLLPPAARIVLEGVVFARNAGNELARGMGAANLRLAQVTAAENQLLQLVATGTAGTSLPAVNVTNSVFADAVPVFALTPGTSRTAACLVVADASGLDGVPDVVVDDPGLVDPAAGDVHLRTDSPAVDACLATPLLATTDADGTPRGTPASPTAGERRYDAGADELGSGADFSDGFESGDFRAWATTR
jgi:hypothetical protein